MSQLKAAHAAGFRAYLRWYDEISEIRLGVFEDIYLRRNQAF